MKIVWQLESVTGRDVYQRLLEQRQIAYTTVMTVMNVLERKGYLRKQLVARAYVYSSRHPKNKVIRAIVEDFVNSVFNGSVDLLLAQLVRDRKLSSKDVKTIVRICGETE